MSIEGIKYLGRIHYCARDGMETTIDPSTVRAGAAVNEASEEGVWGEHEIDYILFVKATVDLKPNPEEVRRVQVHTFGAGRNPIITTTITI
jgi:isopentenyldiphosphate isomerase